MDNRWEDFQVGEKYRIVYRLWGQKANRVVVAPALGWNSFLGMFDFNLRPEGGTLSLPEDCFIAVEQVNLDTPVQVPTIYRAA